MHNSKGREDQTCNGRSATSSQAWQRGELVGGYGEYFEKQAFEIVHLSN